MVCLMAYEIEMYLLFLIILVIWFYNVEFNVKELQCNQSLLA